MRNSPLLRGGGREGGSGVGLTAGGSQDTTAANRAWLDPDVAAAAAACQSGGGRAGEAPCRTFVLDVSEIAQELGLPTCTEVRAAPYPSTILQCHTAQGSARRPSPAVGTVHSKEGWMRSRQQNGPAGSRCAVHASQRSSTLTIGK